MNVVRRCGGPFATRYVHAIEEDGVQVRCKTMEELLRTAAALYAAKGAGRNRASVAQL
ncbi:MAG: hypothetical protein K0R38_421 [Polyangiaceae bacterium]|jgi:hypothetical protein|nr:hypothetical protein [Polyangiaceae bacterium]